MVEVDDDDVDVVLLSSVVVASGFGTKSSVWGLSMSCCSGISRTPCDVSAPLCSMTGVVDVVVESSVEAAAGVGAGCAYTLSGTASLSTLTGWLQSNWKSS